MLAEMAQRSIADLAVGGGMPRCYPLLNQGQRKVLYMASGQNYYFQSKLRGIDSID